MERQYRENVSGKLPLNRKDLPFLLALLAAVYLMGVNVNSDTWFLLNNGRYVESYGIPHTDPFTFHENLHYVMQQWLFSLLLWKMYSFFGVQSLLVYSHVVGVAIIFALAGLLWQISHRNRQLVAAIAIPASLYHSRSYATQRPWTISFLMFVLEVFLLEHYREKHPKWLLGTFFVISVFCINIQAAMWPMLMVLLLPYLADALFRERCSKSIPCENGWKAREISVLLLVIFLGGFLNPYSWEGMQYGLLTYGHPSISNFVLEMFPISFKTPNGVLTIVSAVFLTAFYARHPVPLRLLLLAAGTGLMAFMAGRNITFFVLFGFLGIAWQYRNREFPTCPVPKVAIWILCIMAVLSLASFHDILSKTFSASSIKTILFLLPPVLLAILFYRIRWFCYFCVLFLACSPVFLQLTNREMVPLSLEEPVHVIQQDDANAKVLTNYMDGGYVEFCGLPCYYDPRGDVFLEEANWEKDFMGEHAELAHGRLHYREFFATYPEITHVLTRENELLYTYLPYDSDFELIYDSSEEDVGKIRVFRRKS